MSETITEFKIVLSISYDKTLKCTDKITAAQNYV